MPAARMPFQIFPLESAATRVMAQKQREKYSHGPSISARSAIRGATTVAISTDITVPRKEAVIPMANAFDALPFNVIGYPSKQVAIEELEPGMPISTAEINVPDTPPIHIASNTMNEVVVDSPNVTGSSSEIPSVALSPGIAPKIMPTITTPVIRRRLSGCKQVASPAR